MIYRHLLRPALFNVAGRDAEAIHERVLGMLARVSESPRLTRGLARFAALAWPGDLASESRPAVSVSVDQQTNSADNITRHALNPVRAGKRIGIVRFR